jgi:hypothetical protein
LLVFGAAITEPAKAMERDGPRQGVAGFALVEFGGDKLAQVVSVVWRPPVIGA